ncbi:interferon-induced, double-stranded RNA-activated protein kinase-like [Mastacembelus armatus]|uniref:interferon-induced, double-stranded RNA-activated protein kinase-like n=1 Tax=Mastacembelus armatus TaxID=205130 RepID=UPI000E45B823|nr:interferon-induced, double-stranded RNA-activated protein kinase-like [Mastacembelus armatus]
MAMENYVARLNEYTQKTSSQLRYEDVACVGPDHIRTFTIRAVVNDKAYPDGVGKNKKEAKQNAAKNALSGLFEESTESTAEPSSSPVHQTRIRNINYTCWLNEYSQKNRVTIRAVESIKLGPSNPVQCCSFVVGDREYPAASGKTKKEAKEEAAKLVYNEIHGCKTPETRDDKYNGTPSPQNVELNQNLSDICDRTKNLSVQETNFIGIINLYCQKTSRSHAFIEERRCGPAHSHQFFYKLVINNKEYPVGEGKTVKEAKQHAAQLACAALQEQPEWDSKMTSSSGMLSTPRNTPEPCDTPLKRGDLKPSKDQVTPDVKPRIRLAANFQNALRNSKEDIPNFTDKNTKNSPSLKKSPQPVISRFTSEFDCIERLGTGAFGRVFKARQKLPEKYYAIKVVRYKEKALREVGALSDLHHPNIIRYYACWMEDTGYQWDSAADTSTTSQSSGNSASKYLYIQMELCDTKTLRVWIDEKNTQNVKKSLRNSKRREESLIIAQQIVSGVEYIHSKMLIHRDLKPANIMFGREGEVKIGDFGLVTAENDDDAENLLERTVYKGTPSYMAPEQKSRSTYDRKVDIFALGLIYFELLWNLSAGAERKPIWDDARQQQFPQGFSYHFPQEKQIIKTMLRVKPEDRPEASKIKTDLDEFARSLMTLTTMHQDRKTV